MDEIISLIERHGAAVVFVVAFLEQIGAPVPAIPVIIVAGALAVTSGKRSALMPDLPTVAESGVPGYEAYGWFGLAAPAKTPRELVNRINAEVLRVLQLPEMKTRLAELGAEPATYKPDEFLAFIRRDNAKWEKLIKERNIEIERARLNI